METSTPTVLYEGPAPYKAQRLPEFANIEPTHAPQSQGRIDLSIVKAHLREEIEGIKYKIRENPHSVLEAFDQFVTQSIVEDDEASFYVAFEFGYIPEALQIFIETEPNDLLKVEMHKAVASTIHETLVDVEYTASTLKGIRVPIELARLRAECVPFSRSRRQPTPSVEESRHMFAAHLQNIQFESRSVSKIIHDIQPYLSHSLPTEVGDPKEFEHLFKVYEARWPSLAASSPVATTSKAAAGVEEVPVIVAKVYKLSTSGRTTPDTLVGTCAFHTAELMDHRDPLKSFWKALNPPLVYKVMRTDFFNNARPADTVRESIAADSTPSKSESAVSFTARNATGSGPITTRTQSFTSIWRVIDHFHDGCTPLGVLISALASLKGGGDYQVLPNGYTIAVQYGHTQPFFGELLFRSLFIPPDAQARFTLKPELRTMQDWLRYHQTSVRRPFDLAGGRLLPALYNPNVGGEDVRSMGKVEFELHDYEDIRIHEAYAHLLDEHALLRWKAFLTGRIEGEPAVEGGDDQWLATEAAYETAVENTLLGTNWMHSVNYHFGPKLPRFLLECWVGQEFCGEYLLPELADLSSAHQNRELIKLVQDASQKGGITRPDYRKRTAPTTVRGWLWAESRWRLIQPRSGRLSVKIREARNISTRSVKDSDMMPGTPQVCIWMYDKTSGDWHRVLDFTPFQHALYFLKPGQATTLMKNLWQWNEEVLGPEPEWFNYFSWDAPGSMASETQEIPVDIANNLELKRCMRFTNLRTRYDRFPHRMWTLSKNGIPSILRPLIWTDLSGALELKSKFDAYVGRQYVADSSAYDFVSDRVRDVSAPVFELIDADLEIFAAACGLEVSHKEMLAVVLKTLCYVASPPRPNEFDTREIQERVSIDACGANIGQPIVYSSRLIIIAYYLSLEYNSVRLSEEEMFYLLLSLTSGKNPRPGVRTAPFSFYFSSPSEGKMDDVLPRTLTGAQCDAMLLKTTIKWLHPDTYATFRKAGVPLDALLAPHLNSLCAGLLPSQSLYRLWDMIFNVAFTPADVVQIEVTRDDLEEQIVRLSQTTDNNGGLFDVCVNAQGFVAAEDSSSKTVARAHDILFDGSTGRRILFAFAYSFCLRVAAQLPHQATPQEIHHAVQICGARLRDPSEVVRLVERGDFLLFTSPKRVMRLSRVHEVEKAERLKQLERTFEQSKFVTDVVWPPAFRDKLEVPTNFVLRYNTSPDTPRIHKVSGEACRHPGLSTKELKEVIYPTLKHHALYCDSEMRRLPPNTQGRVAIKLDSITFHRIPEQRVSLCVSFDRTWVRNVTKHKVVTRSLVPSERSVFVYNITRPPPYTVKIAIQTEDGQTIAKMNKAIPIRKLTTQGLPCTMVPAEFFDPPEVEAFLSWAVFVPTSEMFLPELGGRGLVSTQSLRPGSGLWGDQGTFQPLYVESNKDFMNREHFFGGDIGSELPKLAPFNPIDRPRCFSGFTKNLLEDVLFFGFPNFIHCADELICVFGQVRDRNNFQQVLNTPVSLREFIATLIVASTGEVLDKIALLFDLFGHHEPEKLRLQEEGGEHDYLGSNLLYYFPLAAADNPCANAMKQTATMRKIERAACSVDPMLPADALPGLVEDSRTRMNAISLSACAALTAQLLPRAGIHLNHGEMIQFACQLFDPFSRVPRVLMAVMSATGATETLQQLNIEVPRGCWDACGPNSALQAQLDALAQSDESVDVTSAVIDHVLRSTAETGFYGLNFFTFYSLELLGIEDPFPGREKSMTIIVTPTGDLADVQAIVLDVSGTGDLTGGFGGNYLANHARHVPTHLSQLGPYSSRRDDLFFVEGSKALQQASYTFDLHKCVIDKFQFILAFLSNPILTDILRRPSIFARQFTTQPAMKIDASLFCKFSRTFYDNKVPLKFINQQPPIVRRRRPKGELTDESREGSQSPTSSSPMSPGNSPQADFALPSSMSPKAFQTEAVHASAQSKPTVRINVKEGRNLRDTDILGKIDPYTIIEYAGQQQKTSVRKRGGSNVLWNETFDFDWDPSHTRVQFVVMDKDTFTRDDLVGSAEFDLRNMLSDHKHRDTLIIPLWVKDTMEGEIEFDVELLDVPFLTPVNVVEEETTPPVLDVTQLPKKDRKSKQVKLSLVSAELDLEGIFPQAAQLNPYVKIACGSQFQLSKRVPMRNSDPVWNENFRMTFGYLPEAITFTFLDDDLLKNDHIGEAVYQFADDPGRGEKQLRLPIKRNGKTVGHVDIVIRVSTTRDSDGIDLDWKNVKVTIQSARQLPTALTPKLQAYCVVDFDEEEGRTTITEDNHGEVFWGNALQRSLERPPRRPIKFDIYAVTGKNLDILLGGCSLDLEDAKKKWKAAEGEAYEVTLRLDGYAAATGGVLDIEVDFGAPPRNIGHLRYFRVCLGSVHQIVAHNAQVSVTLEDATQTSDTKSSSYGDSTLSYHQTFDFSYRGQQTVSFDFCEGETRRGTCAYDLWALLRQGRSEDTGMLPLIGSDETVIGMLQCSLHFLESAPPPWSDMVLVDIAALTFNRIMPSPQKLYVRRAEQFAEISQLEELVDRHTNKLPRRDTGSRFHVGRTFGVSYDGQPAIWMDLALSDNETCFAELCLPRFGGLSKTIETADILQAGRPIGQVEYKLRFCDRPERVEDCRFVRLDLVAINKTLRHFEGRLKRLYLSVKIGSSEAAKTAPLLAMDYLPVNDVWVLPYSGQPFLRFFLHDANDSGRVVSSAEANVWELMNGESNAVVDLHQGNSLKGGKVFMRTDFICPPQPMVNPKCVRVGFRSAEELGGAIRMGRRDLAPFVRVRSGPRFVMSQPAKNPFNPLWGDWTARLKLDADDPVILVELWDQSREETVGSAQIHIWDTFRDPWAEWAGSVTLRSDKDVVGTVNLAMRLQIPQRIIVAFNKSSTRHPPLTLTRVHPSDTPRDFRHKFIAACREIAAKMDEPGVKKSERQILCETAECAPTQKVAVVRDGQLVLLSDRVRFIDTPEIFPDAAATHQEVSQPIELMIVHVTLPGKEVEATSRALQRQREMERHESPKRGEARLSLRMYNQPDEDEEGSDMSEPDDGFTYFPMGESTMPPSLTVGRHANVRDQLKLADASALGGAPRNMSEDLIRQLSRRIFEFHPNSEAPVGALGHAVLPLTELHRSLAQFKLRLPFGRTSQWGAVVIHNVTPENYMMSRMSPVETVVGYDLPSYGRTLVLPRRDVLPAFTHDLAGGDVFGNSGLYQDPGCNRHADFISAGAAPWIPPAIPRTRSLLEEDLKSKGKRSRRSPRSSARSAY